MVLVDKNYNVIEDPASLMPQTPKVKEVTSEQLSSPGWLTLAGAALRSENTIGSFIASETRGVDPYTDDGFDSWDFIKDDPLLVKHQGRFLDVVNSEYAPLLAEQIYREEEDREIIKTGGVAGIAASVAAGLIDWTTLLPGGVYVKGVKSAYSISKSAAVVGAFAAAGTAVQEGSLQLTQQTRTAEESAVAIGAGTLIGGIFGAAGAKFANAAYIKRVSDEFEPQIVNDIATNPDTDNFEEAYNAVSNDLIDRAIAARETGDPTLNADPASIAEDTGLSRSSPSVTEEPEIALAEFEDEFGIFEDAVVYGPTSEGLTEKEINRGIAGTRIAQEGDIEFTNKTTAFLSRATLPNAALQLLRSPSPATRQAGLNLVEYGFPLKVKDGVRQGLEGAAESRMKRVTQGMYVRSIEAHNDAYTAYAKLPRVTGVKKLTSNEFSERVTRAMRRGDIDPENEYVTKAAEALSQRVIRPAFERSARA